MISVRTDLIGHAAEFHFSIPFEELKDGLTDGDKKAIEEAVRASFSGFRCIEFIARRVLIVATTAPEKQPAQAEFYRQAIAAAIERKAPPKFNVPNCIESPPLYKAEHGYDLSRIHTRELLAWRDKCYACGGSYDPTENHGPEVSIKEIKAELAKREHIPNKKEAKAVRQQKAHAKKHR